MASVGKNLRKPVAKKCTTKSGAVNGEDLDDEANGADIGDALRSAYEKTVSEDIPEEMLDLLGKLD